MRKQTKGAIDQATVNFSVFEDLTEYLGIASVTLPSLTWLTQQLNGSGIGGNIEAVLAGMVDAMTLTMNFRQHNDQALRLCSPRMHSVTLRVAQQQESPIKAATQIQAVKHTFRMLPKSLSGGNKTLILDRDSPLAELFYRSRTAETPAPTPAE